MHLILDIKNLLDFGLEFQHNNFISGCEFKIEQRTFIFYFNGFTSKWQESKDSNIKPVTVKEVESLLYSSETSLPWASPHLTLMYNLLYTQLREPGRCIGSI